MRSALELRPTRPTRVNGGYPAGRLPHGGATRLPRAYIVLSAVGSAAVKGPSRAMVILNVAGRGFSQSAA